MFLEVWENITPVDVCCKVLNLKIQLEKFGNYSHRSQPRPPYVNYKV